MGDHRAEIHITFDFHGKKYKCDLGWINYCPTEVEGVEQRVIEFFRESYDDGLTRFNKQVWKDQQAQRDREAETKDRAEFKRLSEKYKEQQ